MVKAMLSGAAYVLGTFSHLGDLIEQEGISESEVIRLKKLGLKMYSHSNEPKSLLYRRSIIQTLTKSNCEVERVDAVFAGIMTDATPEDDMEMWRALNAVGLKSSAVFGIGSQESATFGGALHIAQSLVNSGQYKNILILMGATRKPGFRVLGGETVVSDGAGSCLVTSTEGGGDFEIIATAVLSNPVKATSYDNNYEHGFLVDESIRMIKEISGALYERSGVHAGQVSKVLCTNANRSIYDIFAHYTGVEKNKIVRDSLAQYGHVNICDNIIDISDGLRKNSFSSREYVMLINWARNTFTGAIIRYAN
jgi:3-oxoacyl-[acyl-carrier-protein] synthase III